MKSFVVVLLLPALVAGSNPWRIMAMGDSITAGGNLQDGGYRCHLSTMLDSHGIHHELVGPMQDKCGGHAGYNGQTLEQIAMHARSAVADSTPDVVILQAGTNDFYFYRNGPDGLGANASEAAKRIEVLLDELYVARPNLIVAVSTVTHINVTRCANYSAAPWHPAPCPADMPDNINKFNSMLPDIVSAQQAKSRNVLLHDVNADAKWDSEDYYNWGIHFSVKGYEKIAKSWLSSLLPLAPKREGAQAIRPIRGWMSWEKFTCETDCTQYPDYCISERLVMTIADAMENEGFVAAGYDSVQIDDCWLAPKRDPKGDLQADQQRFPRGIKYVADYVHSKGMKLGLYSDVGFSTCCGLPSLNVSAVPDAKADAQLQRDAELLMSWGMDSLKVDGCNADVKVMNLTYPKLGAALKAAAKKLNRPSPWFSCSWPDYVGDTLCGGSRTEPCVPLHDIAATCQSARMYSDIADTWQDGSGGNHGIKNIMDFWTKNPQFAALRNALPPGTTYFNDPDQLMIGNRGLSQSEAEAQMGMWVMWAAPLILSTELRNGSMSADAKAILLNADVLAVADDPLGLQATQCVHDCSNAGVLYGGAVSVWTKTLADGNVAVALLNTGNFGYIGNSFGSFNISFTAAAVGLACGASHPAPAPSPATTKFKVRDLFKKKDLGTFGDGFWSNVDESSIMFLRLSCVEAESYFLV